MCDRKLGRRLGYRVGSEEKGYGDEIPLSFPNVVRIEIYNLWMRGKAHLTFSFLENRVHKLEKWSIPHRAIPSLPIINL